MLKKSRGWIAGSALLALPLTACAVQSGNPSQAPQGQSVQTPVQSWLVEPTSARQVSYLFGVDGELFGTAAEGTLLHRSISGTWTSVQTDPSHTWGDIWGADSGEVHAVGGDGNGHGLEAVTHDGGATWSVHPSQYAGSVWGTTRLDYFITGEFALAHTIDGGKTWTTMLYNPKQLLRHVRGSGQTIYVETNPGSDGFQFIYVSQDSGASWSREGVGGTGYGPLFTNGTDTYCAWDGYGLVRRVGNVWQATGVPFPYSSEAWQEVVTSAGVIYVPSRGGLLVSADGGNSWTAMPLSGDHGALRSIWTDGIEVFVGAEDGNILHGPAT